MVSPHLTTGCKVLENSMTYRIKRRPKWLDILGFTHSKEQLEKWRWQGLFGLCLCGIILTVYSRNQIDTAGSSYFETANGASRHLLSTSNDSNSHLPEWERCDFEEAHTPYAWLFNHIVCVLIIFIALAIICDDFFVPSLEVISEKLQLSEDVAGATFMAAGSSAPELFTSVAGVAVETDVGVGTIVGSAVFNLLIIIALTAALAGQILHLDWRPLIRDAFFYAMSIACFIGFAWDGYFQHYEAVILLSLYALYIILMVFNSNLMDWMETWHCCCSSTSVSPSEEEKGEKSADHSDVNHSNPKLNDGHANGIPKERKNSMSRKIEDPIKEEAETNSKGKDGESDKEEESDEETIQLCPCLPCCPAVRSQPPSSETAKTEGGCKNWFMLVFRWFLYIPAFPFICLFSWTIPDCSKEHNQKYFILSFLMSVLWIAILSFGMVTLVGRFGCIIGIDSYVMGLVVVAVGTSIPDALSSVLVARDGFGDMAVSNAIGSNVFDINLGLGLPFIIRIAIDRGKPISLLDATEWVDYFDGTMPIIQHAKFGFILLLILAVALIMFFAVRFRLNKWIGITFVCIYVMFLAYAFIQELYCIRKLGVYC